MPGPPSARTTAPNGDAWGYLPHDLARSKAYRWGEDGIAGICDRYQLLCFAPAFWNGSDPILKERFFGVTPHEGNHGEDVKEYYFHLDNTPTHSYMKLLYKYPQAEFPTAGSSTRTARRNGQGFEFELLDTGVFDEDRYFDIVIEYAKATTEDLCIRIEAFNRGPDAAPLHILPHLWFRNTWAWDDNAWSQPAPVEPHIRLVNAQARHRPSGGGRRQARLPADHSVAIPPRRRACCTGPAGGAALFTDNETNGPRVFGAGHQP